MPPDEVGDARRRLDADEIRRDLGRRRPGGLILAAGHVGNNEAVAAGVAHHGLPINVVADDSSFPELFELLRRQREQWGVDGHPVAQPARDLRRPASAARCSALLVDWGYRSDGIPVRLFGAWTTLPAGPATLAAKTGSRILPIVDPAHAGRRFDVTLGGRRSTVAVRATRPSSSGRPRRWPTRSAATIAPAPEQWYSFKPIWPATAEARRADLERRAAAMLAGPAGSRARVAGCPATRPTAPRRTHGGSR